MPPHLLTLRGRNALSSFRVAKLFAALSRSRPDHAIAGIAGVFWHFVDFKRALDLHEREPLARLLTYGPPDEVASEAGEFLLVVPRPGTISPWSSKATDIAINCGLAPVTRIERGVGYRVRTRDGGAMCAADRAV